MKTQYAKQSDTPRISLDQWRSLVAIVESGLRSVKSILRKLTTGKAYRVLLSLLTYVHVGKAYRVLLSLLTYVHVGKRSYRPRRCFPKDENYEN